MSSVSVSERTTTGGLPRQRTEAERTERGRSPADGGPSGPQMSDGQLLALLRDGDDRAWELVIERYRRVVCCAVRRVLSSPADVDEAAQRTWMALWRFSSSIRDASRLPGWLAITARREALAVVRGRRREVLVADTGGLDTAHFPDSWVLVEQAERARYLRAAVERLPERQRRLMRELLADRSSYDELSRSLDMPRGSIGPMRARALRSLRSMLWSLEPESA